MQLEDFFTFESEPVECIRLKGTRIDLDFVIELHRRHMIPEQIAVQFGCPLEPVQVYAPITYYLQNKAAIDAYVERRKAIADANYQAYLATTPAEALKRLRALKTGSSVDKP